MINGRELKVGSVFIPAEEKYGIYKVTEITNAKPGKHGSAKSIVSAKQIKSGKSLLNTYLDSSERVTLINDFGYKHDVVYDKHGTELCTDLEEGTSIYVQSFIPEDQPIIEEEFKKLTENGSLKLTNAEGHPLVIKYSELDNVLIFWELLYVKPSELQRLGILKYNP